jgi:hypothetical protein
LILLNLIHINISNLIAQVFRQMLRILTFLPMTLWQTTHQTQRRSRLLMTWTYFREMSCHTLSLWVRCPSIRVSVPPILNMRLLTHCRMIPSTPSSEFQRRKHLLTRGMSALPVKPDQETHTTRLSLGECFIGVNVFDFIWETVVCILVYSRDLVYFLYFKSNSFLLFYDFKLGWYKRLKKLNHEIEITNLAITI